MPVRGDYTPGDGIGLVGARILDLERLGDGRSLHLWFAFSYGCTGRIDYAHAVSALNIHEVRAVGQVQLGRCLRQSCVRGGVGRDQFVMRLRCGTAEKHQASEQNRRQGTHHGAHMCKSFICIECPCRMHLHTRF